MRLFCHGSDMSNKDGYFLREYLRIKPQEKDLAQKFAGQKQEYNEDGKQQFKQYEPDYKTQKDRKNN